MKVYFADTNFFLRFILHDNQEQARVVTKNLQDAKQQKIIIKLISEVIPEIEYVLRRVYSVPRKQIADSILSILKTDFIEIEKREVWSKVFEIYSNTNIDPVDILLFLQAHEEDSHILTFDKDFEKLKRL